MMIALCPVNMHSLAGWSAQFERSTRTAPPVYSVALGKDSPGAEGLKKDAFSTCLPVNFFLVISVNIFISATFSMAEQIQEGVSRYIYKLPAIFAFFNSIIINSFCDNKRCR